MARGVARAARRLLEQQQGPDTTGRAMSRWVNRTLGNQQLGFMLAFLGRKVLGQYDVFLPADDEGLGRAIDPGALARLALPITGVGFALAAASGRVMFVSQFEEMIANKAFVWKMALIAVAGLNALAFTPLRR